MVHLIASDWRKASLSSADLALCTYAEKLTQTPSDMTDSDIISLRLQGFNDRAIHDATQVIAYFNYINRIADGLDVEQEDFIQEWEKKENYPDSS
ncbi:MAG: hypothetical protein WAM60_05195 [Candidatus Promineifilaceae bacterium]